MTAQWWETPEFAAFVPHLRAGAANDARKGRHARIELASSTPWLVVQRALDFQAQCAACKRPIKPFRTRRAASKRGHGIGAIYLAATCELSYNVACARGPAASTAYDAIEKLIQDQASGSGTAQGALL